jgi:hypothetical protein
MRVFLDANVLFSAANPGSTILRLIDLVIQDHVAVSCDLAVEEASRNLKLKRPDWEENFLQLISRLETAQTILFELPIELEAKDRPILCSAIYSACDLLATGDRRHFGPFYDQTIQGVTVVSLLELANRIIQPGK